MKTRVLWPLAISAVLVLCLAAGCGVPQDEYDRVNARLKASQEEYGEVTAQLRATQAEYDRVVTELDTLEAQIAEFQKQTENLKEQYELVGKTPAETAENIVKRYHETHIYSLYDFFVCSDMALDVWNMLKAQGINALIQIGNVGTPAKDITEADHAWVLAEISPGQHLALETTGGYVVWHKDNPLYYQGWSFDNPKEYKQYVEFRQEYNVRVNITNQLIISSQDTYGEYKRERDYYQELVDEFNTRYAGNPVSPESQIFEDKIEDQLAIVKEKEGRYLQLDELVSQQQKEIENIIAEMKELIS